MKRKPDMTGEQKVKCSQCLREIPESAAVIPEAQEYFAYFCGFECLRKWQGKAKEKFDHNSDKPQR